MLSFAGYDGLHFPNKLSRIRERWLVCVYANPQVRWQREREEEEGNEDPTVEDDATFSTFCRLLVASDLFLHMSSKYFMTDEVKSHLKFKHNSSTNYDFNIFNLLWILTWNFDKTIYVRDSVATEFCIASRSNPSIYCFNQTYSIVSKATRKFNKYKALYCNQRVK